MKATPTMTVGQLKRMLEQCDDNMHVLIFVHHDYGDVRAWPLDDWDTGWAVTEQGSRSHVLNINVNTDRTGVTEADTLVPLSEALFRAVIKE